MNLFESPGLTPADFSLWGWMKSKMHKGNTDTREEMLVRILDTTLPIKKLGNQLKQRTIFAHELQSALRLAMGFLDIYCEL